MITFNRSQIVSAEFADDETIRFTGLQEDHIYGMEISMDVRLSDGVILSIQGIMKRFTSPFCPGAVPILQRAVGVSLRETGWDNRVMREIGRQGCEHFAEIIIECGRCLDYARVAKALLEASQQNPAIDEESFIGDWRRMHPEAVLL